MFIDFFYCVPKGEHVCLSCRQAHGESTRVSLRALCARDVTHSTCAAQCVCALSAKLMTLLDAHSPAMMLFGFTFVSNMRYPQLIQFKTGFCGFRLMMKMLICFYSLVMVTWLPAEACCRNNMQYQ